MEKEIIAVFDFDGTITTKDTFIEFIKFSKGKLYCYLGFCIFLPWLVAYKLKLYPNYKVKQKIFSFFFKGMKYSDFCLLGEHFQQHIDSFIRKPIYEKLLWHMSLGHKIFIITASIYEWVAPWCQSYGIANVLSTKVEVSLEGYLTGFFSTKNCYGEEKVLRLLQVEPIRESYSLYAYGDSEGDKELLSLADVGIYV